MNIENHTQAKDYARDYLRHETLVVTKCGSIFAKCDVEEVCDLLDNNKQEYFIIKGERSPVKIKEDESES